MTCLSFSPQVSTTICRDSSTFLVPQQVSLPFTFNRPMTTLLRQEPFGGRLDLLGPAR
jgi:hypothetical protein